MQVAKANGKPYGKILTTTPNNLDIPEGKFCKEMMDEAAMFTEDLYDWDEKKVRTYIDKNSGNDFIYIEYSYKELGLSKQYFRNQCRALFNDMALIKREILLEWLEANNNSPFTEEQIAYLQEQVIPSVGHIMLKKYYKMNLYDSLNPNLSYIIGVDVAGGLSRDDSAISIIHPQTLKIVGNFRNNTIDSVDLTGVILDLVISYLPKSVVVVERNSYGKAILDNLIRTPIAPRLYYEFQMMEAKQTVNDGRIVKKKVKTKVYGVNTDKVSREIMINEILKHVVNDQPECITDKSVYDDIKGLTYTNSGKIEHSDNSKDDGLFSYLVGRYIVSHGKNTAKFLVTTHQTLGDETPDEYKSRLNTNMHQIVSANRNIDDTLTSILVQEHYSRIEYTNHINNDSANKPRSQFADILSMNNDLW